MLNYFLKKLFSTAVVCLGVVTLTFFLIHLVPGDPIDIILGDQATSMDRDSLRKELKLDLPLGLQYKEYLLGLTRLDLGRSLYNGQPVVDTIKERLPATAELTLAAMILAILLGIPLGVWAATRQYSLFDHSVLVSSLVGMSLPGFFLGPLLIWIFAIQWPLFPISEYGGLKYIVLPAVSLALPLSAIIMRMTRASMLDVLKEYYVSVAKAKGLSKTVVYFKHSLGNALIPIITIVGLQVGALLTGTVITETIFDWPGIGTLLLQAIQQRDYPTTQGCILLISIIYVIVNLLTDVAYTIANPQVRLQ